jgi:hypothetical protein
MRKISRTLLFGGIVLSAIPCVSIGATIRGKVMEIHWGAGKASAANGYEVTLYRGLRGTSDFEKIATVRTEIDGSFHFEILAKGEYTLHTENPIDGKPDWGPGAYRRISVVDDKQDVELEPIIVDLKGGPNT